MTQNICKNVTRVLHQEGNIIQPEYSSKCDDEFNPFMRNVPIWVQLKRV